MEYYESETQKRTRYAFVNEDNKYVVRKTVRAQTVGYGFTSCLMNAVTFPSKADAERWQHTHLPCEPDYIASDKFKNTPLKLVKIKVTTTTTMLRGHVS